MKICKRKIKNVWKNVDLLTDGVVNKIIEKMLTKFSTKCTIDNLDKSAEFIFGDSEAKILRNKELCYIQLKKLHFQFTPVN